MTDDFKALARAKFKNWKRCFIVFFISYALSFVLGTILFKSSLADFLLPQFSKALTLCNHSFGAAFNVMSRSLIPLFLLFTFGPTIYAPVASFLTVVLTGIVSGSEASFLMRSGRIALALFEIIFSSASGYFMIIYATMVTLTALRIFTDTKKDSSPALFEGSLFYAAGFRGIFNYRYVLSYVGFYIFISVMTTIIVLIRAFSASLF